jgi:hypothetical protein
MIFVSRRRLELLMIELRSAPNRLNARITLISLLKCAIEAIQPTMVIEFLWLDSQLERLPLRDVPQDLQTCTRVSSKSV